MDSFSPYGSLGGERRHPPNHRLRTPPPRCWGRKTSTVSRQRPGESTFNSCFPGSLTKIGGRSVGSIESPQNLAIYIPPLYTTYVRIAPYPPFKLASLLPSKESLQEKKPMNDPAWYFERFPWIKLIQSFITPIVARLAISITKVPKNPCWSHPKNCKIELVQPTPFPSQYPYPPYSPFVWCLKLQLCDKPSELSNGCAAKEEARLPPASLGPDLLRSRERRLAPPATPHGINHPVPDERKVPTPLKFTSWWFQPTRLKDIT